MDGAQSRRVNITDIDHDGEESLGGKEPLPAGEAPGLGGVVEWGGGEAAENPREVAPYI